MSMKNSDLTAVILAGGQGRRMGGKDKGLLEFEGRLLIEILIDSLHKQVPNIIINANRNQSRYQSYGYPVVADELENFQGPLAGFASAMTVVETGYILTLPCDSPLLAENFIERFVDTQDKTGAPICVAHDGERLQPVYALIDTGLHDSLALFLQSGDRKIDRWYAQHDFVLVDFSDQRSMFQNINTPEDRQRMSQATR